METCSEIIGDVISCHVAKPVRLSAWQDYRVAMCLKSGIAVGDEIISTVGFVDNYY